MKDEQKNRQNELKLKTHNLGHYAVCDHCDNIWRNFSSLTKN